MRAIIGTLTTICIAEALLLGGAPAALAEPVDGTWVNVVNQPDPLIAGPIWDADTNHPIVGDDVELPAPDNSNFADQEMVYSPFSLMTLSNPGDKIIFTGSVDLDGTTNSPATSATPRTQYRFGLFKDNDSAANTGWVGYYMSNKHGNPGTPSGSLAAKPVANTSTPLSVTGQSILTSVQGDGTAASLFNDGKYSMNMTIERNALGELLVSATLTGIESGQQGGVNEFSQMLSATHTAASTAGTYQFDRLVFLSGNSIDTDRMAFSDLDVTFVPAPEGLPGDYNDDGMVDAADYVAWRKGGPLANDTPPAGAGPEDYDMWVRQFGEPSPGSGGGGLAVPEPATPILLALAALAGLWFRSAPRSIDF